MGLSVGTRLGPYEIQSAIGAGGMGEVYRARDTRLDRTVAIKVLSANVASNADLKARFEREARAISALNHPNICQLHDIGSQDGVDFLVMEFIEGEPMSTRLSRGRLPVAELLRIGSEIADALDRAHRAGIVHRDLKPGNIMLTKSGAKLLDFGLAKPLGYAAAAGTQSSPGTAPLLSAAMTSPSFQNSPLTQQGMLVGTVQYMAPEQIEGKDADARSDIFALGAVLYEGATGKRPFEGKSQLSVASAILEKDPEPISAVQPLAPAGLDFVVQTCMAKNPDERYQTAHDVKLQLKFIATSSTAALPKAAMPKPSGKRRILFATVGTIGLILALIAGYWGGALRPQPLIRGSIVLPDQETPVFIGDHAGPPVLSPDGTKIAFTAGADRAQPSIWVRPLNSPTATKLEGTEGAFFPFWSPDSQYLAFFTPEHLNKVPAAGGPVSRIASVAEPRGGSWGADDTILYTPDYETALMRVNASGGTPVAATKLDSSKHTTHRWPQVLPDGKRFIYYAGNHTGGDPSQNGIYFGTLGSETAKLVLATDSAAQYASGYLLFHSQGTLVAQKFDPSSGTLSGPTLPVTDHLMNDLGVWRPVFSASQNGVLIYEPGATSTVETVLCWYDRTGKLLKQGQAGDYFWDPALSPDGTKLAITKGALQGQVYVMDLARGTSTRISFDNEIDSGATWSPDGKYVAYMSTRGALNGGQTVIKMRLANGGASEKEIMHVSYGFSVGFPQFSPDDKYIVFLKMTGPTGASVWAKPLDGSGEAFQILQPPTATSNILAFRVSPNGKWIAYLSNESGAAQVYVAPFPHGDGKWQISNAPSAYIAWRGDSNELYYADMNHNIVAAEVEGSGGDLVVKSQKTMFKGNFGSPQGRVFDVTPDGKQFIFTGAAGQQSTPPMNFILNWTEAIKKR